MSLCCPKGYLCPSRNLEPSSPNAVIKNKDSICWSAGILDYLPSTGTINPITPILQYSNIPTLQPFGSGHAGLGNDSCENPMFSHWGIWDSPWGSCLSQVKVNWAPWSGEEAREMVPPKCSTVFLTRVSPIPEPPYWCLDFKLIFGP